MSSGSSSDSDVPVQKQGTPAYSGSDSDDDTQKAQNTALPSSSDDSDDENKSKPASGVDNMFGDMSSDESGDEKTKSQANLTQDDPMRGSDDEDKRDVTTIPVEIPKINTNLGEQINFVRFPNFLSVEPKPFDAEHYEDEHEEDDDLDEEGRTRLKLKVENTIRWRKVTQPDGTDKIESNAKIVRWSDGTQSLILGNEKYDIQSMKLKGDFNHLFIRQGTGLQGQVRHCSFSVENDISGGFPNKTNFPSIVDELAYSQENHGKVGTEDQQSDAKSQSHPSQWKLPAQRARTSH